MPLKLSEKHLLAVHNHAAENYPRECCGLLLGRRDDDTWEVVELFAARNVAPGTARDRYVMDPMARLAAEKRAQESGLSVIGNYHSHPDQQVSFSKTDLESSEEYLMGEPWVPPTQVYLIVSVAKGKVAGAAAYLVREGAPVSLPLLNERN
jgi:proteasome lid subunit RPN8/RPN11